MEYDEVFVGAALTENLPGRAAEITRQVAAETQVGDIRRHVEAIAAWLTLNPDRSEDQPDFWKEYKLWAIARLRSA